MSDHISSVSKSCFLYIRDLRRIRNNPDFSTAHTIATSLIHSKLDYCNSLYLNLPQSELVRLQTHCKFLTSSCLLNSQIHSYHSDRSFPIIPIVTRICELLIKLQRVQNTLARVTFRQDKFNRITLILEELHWLPIEKRITFKLTTLSYNIKSAERPVYSPTINQTALSDPIQNICWLLMLLKLFLLLAF